MDIPLKLQFVTLFDSISFGLIYSFFNPYLHILTGDHLKIGIFTALYLICQLLSNDAVELLLKNFRTRSTLLIIQLISGATLLIVPLNYYTITILARCIFGLFNHTNRLCKSLLLQNIVEEETDYYHTMHNILSSVGYLVGPVITGCLFSSGFAYSCLLATFLIALNIYVILSIPETETDTISETQDSNIMDKWIVNIIKTLNNFIKSDHNLNWDLLTLKYCFIASMSVFFSKFAQILKYNFDASFETIGFTTAYMNGLVFTSTYLIKLTENFRQKYTVMQLIHASLTILLLSLVVACYSPYYTLYALMCIPISLVQCYLNSVWNQLFSLRKNESLSELGENVGVIAGLTVPIVFGMINNQVKHDAVIMFSIGPILASLYIFTMCTLKRQQPVEVDKDK